MTLLCEFTLFNGSACQVPDIFCASTSTYARNKVTINMALIYKIKIKSDESAVQAKLKLVCKLVKRNMFNKTSI